MPLQNDTPRANVRRTLLYHLEKHVVAGNIQSLNAVAKISALREVRIRRMLLLALRHGRGAAPLLVILRRARTFRNKLLGIMGIVGLNTEGLLLPYRRSKKRMPLRGPDDFTDVEFLEQFRFRKPHFFRILRCFKDWDGSALMSEAGKVRRLVIGPPKHTQRVDADKALMVLLRRLSYPCRWCDMQLIMGGSRTELSDSYNYMLVLIHDRYSTVTRDLRCWRNQFPCFAEQFAKFG